MQILKQAEAGDAKTNEWSVVDGLYAWPVIRWSFG